jgi:hypothetical protein
VIDLENIVDDEKRSVCEKRSLLLARELVLASSSSSNSSTTSSSLSSSFVGLFKSSKSTSVSTRNGLENVLELADRARMYYTLQPPEMWIQK